MEFKFLSTQLCPSKTHVYDNFPYRKNISNFGISANGFFLPVFQSFQVSFSLKVILLYTTIRERVENEVILG